MSFGYLEKGMASETHSETGTKQEANTKVQTLPDYLRAVFRKSKSGFDKVHEELRKLYSSEKKSQNKKLIHRHETSGSFTAPHKPVVDNQDKSNSQKERRLSLRRQWAQSARAKTRWVPGVSNVQRSGSFVSYINEGYAQVPDTIFGKTAVTRTMSLPGEEEFTKEAAVVTKCPSASQVKGAEDMFTFHKTHIENVSGNGRALSNKQNGMESEASHDYINLKSFSLNSAMDSNGPRDNSYEENDNVPKVSLKPHFALRQRNNNDPQYQNMDKEILQTNSRNYRRTSKETVVCDSNLQETESDYLPMDAVGDYLSMDGVGNIKTSVNTASTAKERLESNITKTGTADDLGDSGDYVVGDFYQTESENYRTALEGSTVGDSNDTRTETDYLSMDGVEQLKASVPISNIKKDCLDDHKGKTEPTDELGDSGDYVMGDFCKDQTNDDDPLYTYLEGNPIDDQYASIDIKPASERNTEELDDYVNVDPDTLSRVCLKSQQENDLLPRDIESVYDVPPPFKNPINLKSKSVEKNDKADNNSHVIKEEFYRYSVTEVVECLKTCALPHLASVCDEEKLDGYFFKNFDENLLCEEPFLLNWFHIAKLRLVISGWRPKR